MSTYRTNPQYPATGAPISTQALESPSPQTGSFVTGAFTGDAVNNVMVMPQLHREVLFSNRETPYKANMVCTSGANGVNNNCVCPGGPSGVPYRQQPAMYQAHYMSTLFSPIPGTYSPTPTKAAQVLISERSPLPASYTAMDAVPLAGARCGAQAVSAMYM